MNIVNHRCRLKIFFTEWNLKSNLTLTLLKGQINEVMKQDYNSEVKMTKIL